MKFIDNLTDMGEFMGHLPGYDSLFKEILRIAKGRLGQVEEGRLLYKRGLQLIKNGEPKEVLQYMGQARIRLAKKETLKECIRAMVICSDVYHELGLFWAARMELLPAANLIMNQRNTIHEYPIEWALISKRIAWLELALGRITPFLSWFEIFNLAAEHLDSLQYDIEKFLKESVMLEGVFVCYLVNLPANDIRELAGLENGLERLNLGFARAALLYLNGRTKAALDIIPTQLAKNEKELEELFKKVENQPAQKDLNKSLNDQFRSYLKYETVIMNIRYSLKIKNSLGPILFAENLLGVLESALALANWENLAFIVDPVRILIDEDQNGYSPPFLDHQKFSDEDEIKLIWKSDLIEWLKNSGDSQVTRYLRDLLLNILIFTTIDPLSDLKKELDDWNKKETFARALSSSPTSIFILSTLGENAYDFKSWSSSASS
jgi:hypothetical protein